MIEFIFILPFLAMILALIFFFGFAMMNQQEVKVSARHGAWRHIRGPSDLDGLGINNNFFNGRAAMPIAVTITDTHPDGMDRFVQQSGAYGQGGQLLADYMVHHSFPLGVWYQVSATFPTTVGAWNKFQGSIQGIAARDGVEWRYRQAYFNEAVMQNYLTDVDSMLTGIPAPGNGMGAMLRNLYSAPW